MKGEEKSPRSLDRCEQRMEESRRSEPVRQPINNLSSAARPDYLLARRRWPSEEGRGAGTCDLRWMRGLRSRRTGGARHGCREEAKWSRWRSSNGEGQWRQAQSCVSPEPPLRSAASAREGEGGAHHGREDEAKWPSWRGSRGEGRRTRGSGGARGCQEEDEGKAR
jgi:hypothetical protein